MSTAPYLAIHSRAELLVTAERLGSPYFSPGAMRFFDSRLLEGIKRPADSDTLAGYFVTSERFAPLYGEPEPRRYTVRAFRVLKTERDGRPVDTFQVETVGEFQEHETANRARLAIGALLSAGTAPGSFFD